MKLSLSWVKDYIDLTASVKEICDKLTMVGLEIEEVQDLAAALDGFVVAEVLSVENHPNADKLHVLKVGTGKEILQIVCGAPNVRVGMKSILAPVGVLVPLYGERLKKGVIRGVESQGMLCSEKELCLGDDHTGILDLKTDKPAGTPAKDVFDADVILDVNVTPNRGDCFGVLGLARELAVCGLGTLKAQPKTNVQTFGPCPVSVEIKAPACEHFVLRYLKDVKNVQSPAWMQSRLKVMGLNPISALVDVTNYFTFDACRPLHVFDADKVKGNLVVRYAKAGEKLVALDDKEYTLDEDMLVIADDNGVQSIAGVMGGKATGCTQETKNVLLETAYFDPISVASTARRLKLDSDAKMRFERGIDPASCRLMSEKAAVMIQSLCGGEVSDVFEAGAEPDWHQQIDFDFSLVKKVCGFDIAPDEIKGILTALGCDVSGSKVSVPSWRFHDVKRPIDLVEEVVRIYGLDHLPSLEVRPEKLGTCILKPHQIKEISVRRALALNGLYQCTTYPFMDSKKADLFGQKLVALANPLTADLDVLRPSLLPNLLDIVARNQAHGTQDVPVFELGPVFDDPTPGKQHLHASGLRVGMQAGLSWAEKQRPVDVFDVKADVLEALAGADVPVDKLKITRAVPGYYHPGQAGAFVLGSVPVAYFGALHPKVVKTWGIKGACVGFEVLMDALPPTRRKLKNTAFVKDHLLPVERDFAFVMPVDVTADEVRSAIMDGDKNLIRDVIFFDVYTGAPLKEGEKSIALKVILAPQEKTFTDEEIAAFSTRLVDRVKSKTGAELRI